MCVSIIYSLVSVLVSVSHGGCWAALVLESTRSIAQSVLAEHCIYVWYASLDHRLMAFISHAGRPAAAAMVAVLIRKL